MRIAIDARELSGTPTGVGRYLAGLLREWTTKPAGRDHEFLLYAHRPFERAFDGCIVRQVPGRGGTAWEQWAFARRVEADAADVVFSPAYSTPLFTRVPRVVVLHDVSFIARPEWFTWREGLRRRILARRSAAAARAVITISDFSKREIVRLFGTRQTPVHVIPPGIDAPAPQAGTTATGDISLLYVGSIFTRRHIPELLAAFTDVASRHADVSLHLVGDNRSFPREDIGALIGASPARARITWHRYASEADLHRLYHEARGFVFLSEYEGLGLTPLEALAVGVPPVLLDTAVAREACGQAARYVSLGNTGKIAAEVERVLFDPVTRAAILAAAPAALGRFDWPHAAKQTLAVLEQSA